MWRRATVRQLQRQNGDGDCDDDGDKCDGVDDGDDDDDGDYDDARQRLHHMDVDAHPMWNCRG